MLDEQRLRELLEQVLETSRLPVDLCRDSPELLPELQRRWEKVQRVQEEIDALFPASPDPEIESRAKAFALTDRLPQIPGYEVREIVGHGGMGVVYKAWHVSLHRTVAIKMLLAGTFASPTERKRLTHEAQAVAALCHPNIVMVHDVGEWDSLPYFSMEYVGGPSLAQKLAQTPQAAGPTAELVAVLADAVYTAHRAGIAHRDLKPGNVLLTEDGTPKIADFGLARRFEHDQAATLGGYPAGTPSYMAPEVALGQANGFCPSSDIYSLGALLYEMLTGRPPFHAETPAETQRQVIQEEPAPPSRLNARVPKDLETICLKCLQKDPARRYGSATELAADLRRFSAGCPISARPMSRHERVARWVRRNPTAAALIFTVGLLLTLAGGAAFREWQLGVLRTAELETWSERLAFVVQLQREGRFAEARAILHRFPDAGSDQLRSDVARVRSDLDIVERLDAIRLQRGKFQQGGGIDYEHAAQQYETLFEEVGLGTWQEPPLQVANRLAVSPIRNRIVAALDDWAACAVRETRAWILEVARHLDPDPWRDQVRDQERWADTPHLAELAAAADVQRQPATLMVAMGTRWRRLGGDPTSFLEKVQRQYPDDFWANFELGHLKGSSDLQAAIGYCRAALAVRPDASTAHFNLAIYLAQNQEAEEATTHFARVVELDPTHTWARLHLATALLKQGQLSDAERQLRAILELDPSQIDAARALVSIRIRSGDFRDALRRWRGNLESQPARHQDWDGYAELALYVGDRNEYERACRELLDRFGDSDDPHVCERTGRACLLVSGNRTRIERGAELIDRAIAAEPSRSADWAMPYFQFAKALAEFRNGNAAETIELLQGEAGTVLGPAPGLLRTLALAKTPVDRAAHEAYAQAISQFDWSAAAIDREAWMYHILRREAESQLGDTPLH